MTSAFCPVPFFQNYLSLLPISHTHFQTTQSSLNMPCSVSHPREFACVLLITALIFVTHTCSSCRTQLKHLFSAKPCLTPPRELKAPNFVACIASLFCVGIALLFICPLTRPGASRSEGPHFIHLCISVPSTVL